MYPHISARCKSNYQWLDMCLCEHCATGQCCSNMWSWICCCPPCICLSESEWQVSGLSESPAAVGSMCRNISDEAEGWPDFHLSFHSFISFFLTCVLSAVLSMSIIWWLTKTLLSWRQVHFRAVWMCQSFFCLTKNSAIALQGQHILIVMITQLCWHIIITSERPLHWPFLLTLTSLTWLWPSTCWLLSKKIISQMKKQHLLSYSFTYGLHSCSYELKQVSREGGGPWRPRTEGLAPETVMGYSAVRAMLSKMPNERRPQSWQPWVLTEKICTVGFGTILKKIK